ncbi:hypothetical protein ElyMa_005643700 [Elysia marginata]|uniref:Uncharacterized protein n=1 Tax=Elysia marginata TaxID=1093978 RepID=A0AAV4FAT8_9GAST|nr:hypothetical protein ElyMa_005643700 [Elysia marginata]
MPNLAQVANGGQGRRQPTWVDPECEIFTKREHEGAESGFNWKYCKKNPGHEKFISAQDFKDNYLPRLQSREKREVFRSLILDATVRLRVHCTSLDRPDDDQMAAHRGTCRMRVGTGFICYVYRPEYNKPCICRECNGKVARKQWRFGVKTAQHVVYNTEEAKETKIDLFCDDESCEKDGRMKSVWGVEVECSFSNMDFCDIWCVTCDEDLGERISSAWPYRSDIKLNCQDVSDLGLLPSCDEDCDPALIVSHPHGQPKKITVGELRYRDKENLRLEYDTPTCPGSSGAPVFWLYRDSFFFSPVHSGSFIKTSETKEEKLNYCNDIFFYKPKW